MFRKAWNMAVYSGVMHRMEKPKIKGDGPRPLLLSFSDFLVNYVDPI